MHARDLHRYTRQHGNWHTGLPCDPGRHGVSHWRDDQSYHVH